MFWWFKSKPAVVGKVKEGKKGRWRWSVYDQDTNKCLAVSPVKGCVTKGLAKAEAEYIVCNRIQWSDD